MPRWGRARLPGPAPQFLAGVLLALPLAGAGLAAEDRHLADFQEVIETAKRKVYPALVFVKPVQEDLSEGEAKRVEVLGSGVIFRPDGYVVTNHHVAEKAKEIRCVLGDRRQVDAAVVGPRPATDLAVLKLDLPAGETVPGRGVRDLDGRRGGAVRPGARLALRVRAVDLARDRLERPPPPRGRGAAPLQQLDPDRRGDQPRELGRAARGHPRRGDRDQHAGDPAGRTTWASRSPWTW